MKSEKGQLFGQLCSTLGSTWFFSLCLSVLLSVIRPETPLLHCLSFSSLLSRFRMPQCRSRVNPLHWRELGRIGLYQNQVLERFVLEDSQKKRYADATSNFVPIVSCVFLLRSNRLDVL